MSESTQRRTKAMGKKGASGAKKAVTGFLEQHCSADASFKRNLFILFKQKKHKDIAAAIKKAYTSANNSSLNSTGSGKNDDTETNFLQNSQHVIDIMKHLESYDFSSKSGNKITQKRNREDVDDSSNTVVSVGQKTDKKKVKTTEKEEKEGNDFDEDDMTSFLDQADDDMMKRFYAVSTCI